MKKENAIDRLQDLVTELAYVADNSSIIQCALSDEYVSIQTGADALFAVKNHIERIGRAMDNAIEEVIK